ncbi:MAG TPA: Ni/Fe hydrogenase subunit alpha [Armatimonadota bacterium]|jgi:NAD-reducing hydrogenase large subunit
MPETITIDPVTRIEGHAKITLTLGDDGKVNDAKFHVTQVRGFEKFCEGRPFYEMPSLMARICGICPVSHLIASSKACDALLAVRVPRIGQELRRLMNFGQITQSHALSFFHLSSPDLLLGWDSDPAKRNVFGVIAAHPELARKGIRLRQYGQEIIETLGGRRVHPAWCVPGGVSSPLTAEKRDRILSGLAEAKETTLEAMALYKSIMPQFQDEVGKFGNFPSMFMAIVGKDGSLEHYDGALRVVDQNRKIVVDGVPNDQYGDIMGEAVEPWSFLKMPYYKPMGYPQGMYRVGPLARLNAADKCGTPLADAELQEFRALSSGAVLGSFHYHTARLIEIVYALERIEQICNDPDILDDHVRANASPNANVGIGISEAPRGTLVHHYEIDDNGLITSANLIIATGHNNLAMNAGVLQVAQNYVDGKNLTEGMLNRVEAVIRMYDPCLSCSTHAAGQMPMVITLEDADGTVLDTVAR